MSNSRKRYEFVFAAVTSGWGRLNRARQGVRAFNKTVGNGTAIMAKMRQEVSALVGAYLGLNLLSNTATIISQASTSVFALESAVQSANREFDDVGSLGEWGRTVEDLSSALRVYSRTDLREAAARTLDMTKRLGMSAAQMRVLIERTADLSAGKTDLVGGIERTTAALRGEAESAEYLGLTLNETYVRAWYEAAGATQGAWKNLNDLQKAQVRYQVFLEQTNSQVGRAARSVTTLAGSYQLVRSQVIDAIVDNRDMAAVMDDLAQYLAANSDELGDLAASIARSVAGVAKFIIKHREMIAMLGKSLAAVYLLRKAGGFLIKIINGLRAASVAMTGVGLAAWLGRAAGALLPLLTFLGPVGVGVVGVAAGVGLLALKLRSLYKASQAASQDSRFVDHFAGVSAASEEAVRSVDQVEAAVRAGRVRFDAETGQWVKGYERVSDKSLESAEEQVRVTGKALEEMRAKYEAYVDEVMRLQDEIAGRELSLTEQLREMSRGGMSAAAAWEDLKKQAEEYEETARAAAASGDFAVAVEYADKAKEFYAKLNQEVREGSEIAVSADRARAAAMDGVKRSGELAISALREQREAAREAMEVLTEQSGWQDLGKNMDAAKRKWLDNWQRMRAKALDDIDAVNAALARLNDQEVNVWIRQNVVETKALGGLAGIIPGFARGGSPALQFTRRLPGLITRGRGLDDDVPAMLKRLEFVHPSESVRLYGVRFMEMIRRRLFPVELARGFAGGGTPAGPVALPAMAGAGAGAVYNLTVNIEGDVSAAGVQRGRDIAQQVLRELQRMQRRSS